MKVLDSIFRKYFLQRRLDGMKVGNRLDPDFPEEFVSTMIQTYLTTIRFPRAPFTLLPFFKNEERYLGADAKIASIRPMYLQFKRSFAYSNQSAAGFLKEREALGFTNPEKVLYFDLRNKKDGHRKYQHNILYELRQRLLHRNIGEAFYVAPLFLSRSAYISHIHMFSRLDWPFFFWQERFHRINSIKIVSNSGSIRFQNFPMFREHISIPPHAEVLNHKHRYSYTEAGTEICFHSPLRIEEEALTLGERLYRFMNYREGVPSTDGVKIEDSRILLDELVKISSSDLATVAEIPGRQVPILDAWLSFGEFLSKTYSIEQYLLMELAEE